ncbi:lytic transglycosylase domain-containing protein [Salipiger sp. P9]|uniref:lytic transglycosylase domain-containing protein n=1 Tax=Salipiger pentaromativorans TaxID=2943193 RepID=UPI00215739BD|nr:lytic transglycosylase domain-containing protein [Salipiger pentaromativorans]MCR8546522.1 lytic transglycosylase domain-containing protein [Salipiger pentaromativorans]
MWRVTIFLVLMAVAGPLRAGATLPLPEPGTLCSAGAFGPVECIRPSQFVHDTCQAIAHFAARNGLDPGFFARLLWQESRFDPNARSHANAQGIAQFIPSTARLRGLTDAYNPAEALEYSAEYLGELVRRYGNHGLAAVAYNGGERRADALVASGATLPRETVNYVRIITGLSAETWAESPPDSHDFRLQKDKPFRSACHALARDRRLTAYPTPEPDLAPWGVQLAFGTTKARAREQYGARTRACAALVKGEEPDLIWQKSRASPKGGYWMARIGRNDRDSAWRYCSRLKARGCVCAVYRNR